MNFLLSLFLLLAYSLVCASETYQKPVNLFRMNNVYIKPANNEYFYPNNNLFFFKELKDSFLLDNDVGTNKNKGKHLQYEDGRGC